jgi:tetratricopeptide (TPR) repeat protein
VVHLSCHGDDGWKPDRGAEPRPVLWLEDAEGQGRPTTSGELVELLAATPPWLLMLSACLSARGGDGEAVTHSLASGLVRSGLPAVLGWDGSVADVAATAFAETFYGELARRRPPALAAATARHKLLALNAADGATKDVAAGIDPVAEQKEVRKAQGRNWHLARLWLGPSGGGAIVGGQRARSPLPPHHAYRQIFRAKDDAVIRVADPAQFVGRRRLLQRALATLAGGETSGLLLHGIGAVGKTSLAAKLASRLGHLRLVFVHQAFDAQSVVEALEAALRDHPPARDPLQAMTTANDDPRGFENLLVDLLAGPCRDRVDGRPILLVLDDLEQVLELDPEGGPHRVQEPWREPLRAILRAFDPAHQAGESRLVVTSRFPFTLDDGGRDLGAELAPLSLPGFDEAGRHKLRWRQERLARAGAEGRRPLADADLAARREVYNRALALARGHPGLQDLLALQLALNPEVTPEAAGELLEGIGRYLEGHTDALPEDADARAFLARLQLGELLALLRDGDRRLLRELALFRLPLPEPVLRGLAEAAGAERERLVRLGLLERHEDLVDHRLAAWSANAVALARLDGGIGEADPAAPALAGRAVGALFAAWGGHAGRQRRPYAADLELVRLALCAGDAEVLRACAGDALRGLVHDHAHARAVAMGEAVIARLEAEGQGVPLLVLVYTAEAVETTGEGARADAMLAKAGARARMTADDSDDAADLAALSAFLFRVGQRQHRAGDSDAALATFERLCDVQRHRNDEHQLAVARGAIADILEGRGELDEALRLCREEQLPVYERLGDVRERAVTLGQIADILEGRGELDEALRIYREEELPVYERLGDVRSRAVTMGKIADILFRRGELDEALRLRREEQLPVYERLGDREGIAKCRFEFARIAIARGIDSAETLQQVLEDLGESFRLLQQLGRADGLVAVGDLLAQALVAAGAGEEAATVLEIAATAADRLQWHDRAAAFRQRIDALRQGDDRADPGTSPPSTEARTGLAEDPPPDGDPERA